MTQDKICDTLERIDRHIKDISFCIGREFDRLEIENKKLRSQISEIESILRDIRRFLGSQG